MTEHRSDCARIFERWHEAASACDVDGLLALYAEDAVIETPLVMATLDGADSSVLRGHGEIRNFFREGTRRRPNALVRWHRTGKFHADGGQLVWEYPRETPSGDQVDIVEVMDIEGGKIRRHRIYWGWFGVRLLTENAVGKALRRNATAPAAAGT